MKLEDARAVVTGGGTGIGFAVARDLARAGGKVVICGRREDVLRRAAEEIGAVPVVCDVVREGRGPPVPGGLRTGAGWAAVGQARNAPVRSGLTGEAKRPK